MRFFFILSKIFYQQIVMNDLNMTNTILDTFSVKYNFPHLKFVFNGSLQNQEQQIGGFATLHLSNLNKVIVRINTRHALFKHCVQNLAVRKSCSIISRLNRKCN